MKNIDPAVSQWLADGDRALRSGRFGEAINAYEKALARRPDLPQAHHNLAVALRQAGQLEAAVTSYRRALALQPAAPEIHNNLGNALRDLGLLDAAVAAYRQALALRPANAEIQNNLGAVLQMQGQLDAAIAAFRQSMILDPQRAETLTNLIYTSRMACAWRDLDRLEEKCRAMVRAGKPIPPHHFLSLPSTPAEQQVCARQWTVARTQGVRRLPPPAPRGDGRIRLGYISAKFHQHPSSVLAVELFERHDRERFAVSAYSIGPDDGSALRKRVERAFDAFVDISTLPHGAAARRIREDAIDVLIDLTGYDNNERVPILAARPAPVQVSFLGYPSTMGASFIDYIVADPIALPFDEQAWYSEKIVHLPDCYQPNDSKRAIADATPARALCGLPEQGFVFCCFNNTSKITPAMFDVWMRLLGAVEGSVLWLLEAHTGVRANLVREAAARGIAAERLVFAPRLPPDAHLARHRCADLFLDTLPYNAHTTASDALWAGLPVLTCKGSTFAGRVAASLLHAVGLPELVTHALGEYEALAVRLAREPGRLGALRERLKSSRTTAPLFDSARFARHLEAAFTRMWERHRAGQPPQGFSVAA